MKNTRMRILTNTVLLTVLLPLLASIAEAHGLNVNCDPHGDPPQSDSIQQAIDSTFFGGAIILVTGTCHENIFIGAHLSFLTLDGQGVATIIPQTPAGAPPNIAVLLSGAREVGIRGFTIDGIGTGEAVGVTRGATARIEGNTIKNSALEGIFVNRLGFAVIINNTIENNASHGIFVGENSAARIGFASGDDVTARPNTVKGNGGNGITVLWSSNARIVGNSISSNAGHGVGVFRASHADISFNNISANGRHGISVAENSGVNLGSGVTSAATIFGQPNTTTELNAGFGIRCSIGGYANGQLGTLEGATRGRSFDRTCIDSLVTD